MRGGGAGEGQALHSKTLEKLGAEQGPPLGSFAVILDALGQILSGWEYWLQMPYRCPFPEGYVHLRGGAGRQSAAMSTKDPPPSLIVGPTLGCTAHPRAPRDQAEATLQLKVHFPFAFCPCPNLLPHFLSPEHVPSITRVDPNLCLGLYFL